MSTSNYFISTMFLYLANFCCLYLVEDSFTDYLLCVLFDECVASHNERIIHENRVTIFVNYPLNFRVIFTIVRQGL